MSFRGSIIVLRANPEQFLLRDAPESTIGRESSKPRVSLLGIRSTCMEYCGANGLTFDESDIDEIKLWERKVKFLTCFSKGNLEVSIFSSKLKV